MKKPNNLLIESLTDYSVVPCDKTKKRLQFFYGPYCPAYNVDKHMKFEAESSTWITIKKTILQPDSATVDFMKECINKLNLKKKKTIKLHPI